MRDACSIVEIALPVFSAALALRERGRKARNGCAGKHRRCGY
ncbi:hypothetical protein [Burkholderia cenocepacia]|nr:hypothetical protein [Burkholderia cenocepacia]